MSKVLKNAFVNGFGYFLNAVVLFLLTPFVIHSLGNAAYGVWVVVVSLTGYLGLLDLGTRTTLPKFVAQYSAVNDHVGLNRFVSTLMTISLILGGVVLILSLGCAAIANDLLDVEPELAPLLPALILIVGSNLILGFVFICYQGVLFGYQRYTEVTIVGLASVLVRSGLIYFFLKADDGVMALAIITTGVSAAGWAANAVLAYRVAPQLKIRWFQLDRQELKQITSFSATSFIINIADRVIYYSASLILAFFISTSAVAIFAVAEGLVFRLRGAVLSLVTAVTPAASELQVRKEMEELRRMTAFTTKAILLFIMPVTIGALAVGPDFIRLWMGPGYEQSAVVLSILMCGQVFALSQYGPEMVLYGIGRHKRLAVLMISMAGVIIGLGVALVHSLGIEGVALACAIPLAFGQTVFVPLFIRKYIGLAVLPYVRQAVFPTLGANLVFATALLLFESLWPPDTWILLGLDISLALLLYAPAVYFLSCSDEERPRVRRFALRLIGRAA